MKARPLETEEAVRSIVRLRRAERTADAETARELGPVVDMLERVVGPTVSRAAASRLLGISYSSLDRWIEKKDISSVPTPAGRREIALSDLVALLEDVERCRPEHGRMALADVMRDRRRRAEEIGDDDFFPPPRPRPGRTHRAAELRSLAYHRLVARRLDERVVADARRRLRRWRAEKRIHDHWADAWQNALELPLPQLAKLIASDTERTRELRQTSPFAGALTEQERRRSMRAAEKRALT